jgi:hypothetical protein
MEPYHKRGSTDLNYQSMAVEWNKKVDGVKIFPKLASHIRTFHTTKKKKLNRLQTMQLLDAEHDVLLALIESDAKNSVHPEAAERHQPIFFPRSSNPVATEAKEVKESACVQAIVLRGSIPELTYSARYPGVVDHHVNVAHFTAPRAENVGCSAPPRIRSLAVRNKPRTCIACHSEKCPAAGGGKKKKTCLNSKCEDAATCPFPSSRPCSRRKPAATTSIISQITIWLTADSPYLILCV